jgi:hypothetical protein
VTNSVSYTRLMPCAHELRLYRVPNATSCWGWWAECVPCGWSTREGLLGTKKAARRAYYAHKAEVKA